MIGLSVNPKDAEAWNRKGSVFIKQVHYDKAIKGYDEAIRLDPDIADVWYNKGYTLYSLGKDDEAIKCFDEATG